MKAKIGDIVLVTMERDGGREGVIQETFPALVYKIHPNDYLGVYVFLDLEIRRIRMLPYSAEPKDQSWREK